MTIQYNNNSLYFDDIDISKISNEIKTPYYLYSEATILKNLESYTSQLGELNSLICYSVKANSNLSILSLFAKNNTGFDIVSGGELERVILAGGDTSKVVFSGVGKTDDEIRFALKNNILCFNVESTGELHRINKVAESMGLIAEVSLRVNPEIDPKTHPYITTGLSENKFGISHDEILQLFINAKELASVNACGIDYHIGSQILELKPFVDSAKKVKSLVDKLHQNGITLKHVDIGGGLGISYNNEATITRKEYVKELMNIFKDYEFKIILEPGRSLVGDAGILVTKVVETKSNSVGKNFLVVDAGMNDLLRPPLYNAYHDILESKVINKKSVMYDVVGPICETADFLGKQRLLKTDIGELIIIKDTGAYGFVLSSNYNSRPRCGEYIIKNGTVKCIRSREELSDIFGDEKEHLNTT